MDIQDNRSVKPICKNCKWWIKPFLWRKDTEEELDFRKCDLVEGNPDAINAFIVSGHSGVLYTGAYFGCNKFHK